jgi:hypothetical protein
MSALTAITTVFAGLLAAAAALTLFEKQILRAIRLGKAILTEWFKKKPIFSRL